MSNEPLAGFLGSDSLTDLDRENSTNTETEIEAVRSKGSPCFEWPRPRLSFLYVKVNLIYGGSTPRRPPSPLACSQSF